MTIELQFPLLKQCGYKVTSSPDRAYNCIAWAAGVDGQWWWPVDGYWPVGVARELTLAAFIAAYATRGYAPCSDGTLEKGFEKVVIYLDGSKPTHASRQLQSGTWTSKLGRSHDIEHGTPEGLFSIAYGQTIGAYLRRPLRKIAKKVLKRRNK